MTSIFIVAAVVSVVFLLAKFLEMRHIDKESKPLKVLVKDALVVYFCVIIGNFVINQIQSTVMTVGGGQNVTPVFTDNPSF